MKIIGPIAGVGTRLQPFTFNKPKAFIKVAGKKVIDHILVNFQHTFPEGTDLIFVVGFKKRRFVEYLKVHYGSYFNLHFVEQEPVKYEGNVPIFGGLGEAVYLAKDAVFTEDQPEGDDCLVFLADMTFPAEKILTQYLQGQWDASKGLGGMITVMRVPREEAQHYGVVTTDEDGVITGMVEKPREFVSDLAIAGIYTFNKRTSKRLFEILGEQLARHRQSGRSGEFQFTPALDQLVREGHRMAAVPLDEGALLDFGRPDTLLDGNRRLLERMHLQREYFELLEQKVERTRVVHPVWVGENSKLVNCNIGPYVTIGDDCVLKNCIVVNSVIGDGCQLTGVVTEGSIIGNFAVLSHLAKNSIIVGDSSRMFF
ncbi:MAG: sugar phosphate nucleotidyltransferase [Promethearchaeota archaeon]